MIRTGIGYDAHKFAYNRKLILGGVEIQHEMGLLGHSDADVLAHAIADALLGTIGKGDIGSHFPNKDPQYKGISSMVLLQRIRKLLDEEGWEINNIDSVLILQEPHVAQYIVDMRNNLAKALSTSASLISVKATSTEGMGFEGKGEGISAHAVCTIRMKAPA